MDFEETAIIRDPYGGCTLSIRDGFCSWNQSLVRDREIELIKVSYSILDYFHDELNKPY